MQHETKTFSLITTAGKAVEVETSEFNFEIKELLEKRFSSDKLQKFLATGKLEHDLKLDEVIKDMPLLLKGLPKNVDYKKHNFDTFYAIYFFFIAYERNAVLRHLKSETGTIASLINLMNVDLNSILQNFSEMKNTANIQPGTLQDTM